MPQTILPLFTEDISIINTCLGFKKENGIVYYFQGSIPFYQHAEDDYASFRLVTSQMVVNGIAKQRDIVKAFGVSSISVKRWVKKYKEEGASSFYKKKR